MARKRKNSIDNKLPDRVSKNKYSYYLKTKDNKTITLGPLSMSMVELWAKYNNEIADQKIAMTFDKLWSMYAKSPAFYDLSIRSQKDKMKGCKNIIKVFGNINADNIRPEHIRKYLDIRGEKSRVQANHELSYMSVAFSWGYEHGYCKANPCLGVKKFSIKGREKYITNEEYYAIYSQATNAVKIAMELSYLCATRIADVLDMKWSQISEGGIFIQQGKTGVKQIKQWNYRLKRVAALARKCFIPQSDQSYVILTSDNSKMAYRTFNQAWNTAKKKAENALGYEFNCTFHDIKAKSISDYEGSLKDKQIFSGHKTESQVAAYDRNVKITPTLTPKKQ